MFNFFRKLHNRRARAITCAYLDLIGAKEAMEKMDIHSHDWKAHQLSIDELEENFPELTINRS
jgi:hypothetical protein